MRVILFLLILTVLSNLSFATPDEGIREHDILIGYNEMFYYSIKTISYPDGTYYLSLDSSFIYERDLKTGETNSITFLSARTYQDTTTLGDWLRIVTENKDFNFANFLIDKEIKYLYPSIYLASVDRKINLSIDKQGLKINYKRKKELLLEIDKVEIFAKWIKKYQKLEDDAREKFPNLTHEYKDP